MDVKQDKARFQIIDPATGAVLGECHGAGAFGMCPQAADGEIVPCAGARLAPRAGTSIEGWTLSVAPGSADGCPLAFLPVRDGG
jgi:hypothetical protein